MAVAPKKDAGNADADAGSKKKKLFLIIGLAVALVAISVGGTVVALKMLSPAPAGGAAEEHAKEAILAPAIYFEMTPNFTINFNVNGRQRYLQAAITLLYRDPELESLLTLHMPAIRNGLVMLLSSKNFDELQTEEGKETLRAEALEIIRGQLQKEREALIASGNGDKVSSANVEQVLFTNFVMQ
ncbi:flagellar basal body-associated FliL family protein [Cellvibrio sp. UBA7661]|uniref:flagellar basal body-associated FliL family protein n=1 Tax=Cellvibrio sp. UBA7661 TaxID=1946311 RepID=UPI002F354F55